MQQVLGTLPLNPLSATLGLLVAILWAWWLSRSAGARALRFKATFTGLLSLGLKTSWRDGERPPELLLPSALFLASLAMVLRGTHIEIPIFGYGFSLMLGFMAAIALSCARARQAGIDANHIIDLGMLAVVFGVLGARAFYYIEFYDRFANEPWWAFFAIWEGGIVYYGGLLLAAAVSVLYCRLRGHRLLALGDIVAPALALGLSFGRIGCFLNGCCWGRVCAPDFPLGVQFPRDSFAWWRHVEPYISDAQMLAFHERKIGIGELLGTIPPDLHHWSSSVHPAQLYAWAAALLLVFILLFFERRLARREGQGLALFFVCYAISRFFLEMSRGDHPEPASLDQLAFSPGQSVGLLVLPVALLLFVIISFKGRRLTPGVTPGDQR